MASRDLPPLDSFTHLALPRSPAPIPDEALVFARRAAAPVEAQEDGAARPAPGATGADLRGMLERFERAHRRHQALDQAAQARARLVERLSAGKGRPALRLVETEERAECFAGTAQSAASEDEQLERAMDQALASALTVLKRISELGKSEN